MIRSGFACLILASAFLAWPLLAQEPSDLHVELRSATGSNRFQIGEVIPLEVVLSSSTPNRYLEPCELFVERTYGYARCRFSNPWAFTISTGVTIQNGWIDLTKEFPDGIVTGGGPIFDVQSRDLSPQPVTFTYSLTKRFRFDVPGVYQVHFSIDIALDGETTRDMAKRGTDKPHTVSVAREIVLQIVPDKPEWQAEVVREGYEAYSGQSPPITSPPSPALLKYQQATEALCSLGTADAARVLARLLAQGHQEIRCLDHTESPRAAIAEMQRLLLDPDVAVSAYFFSELANLVDRVYHEDQAASTSHEAAADKERDVLLSALSRKRGQAQVTSLLTALAHPPRGGTRIVNSFGYDLPFEPSVIAAVVANYDKFPEQNQQWLLDDGWARVRSPLMLPLVRSLAEAGNGPALLRWMELDHGAAADFTLKEVLRPVPRFSSFYLRLEKPLLPDQEAQLINHFRTLHLEYDLLRAASLLHRYGTSSSLESVRPYIEVNLSGWPCSIQLPALAYLLKVSSPNVEQDVQETLQETKQNPCANSFFTDLGSLEPSPVLERLAMAQVEAGPSPSARDAADYLRLHGSAATKPFIWKQLVRWHARSVSSGAEKRVRDGGAAKITNDDTLQTGLVFGLIDAYTNAQAWVLSPEESNSLQTELGKELGSKLSCNFNCNSSLAVGRDRGDFSIYGRTRETFDPRMPEYDYLNSTERLRYVVNQYHCADLRTLKEKLLQFPAGSTFGFAYEFSAADRDELVQISDFLWDHGYRVKNPQNWSFLRPDTPQQAVRVP